MLRLVCALLILALINQAVGAPTCCQIRCANAIEELECVSKDPNEENCAASFYGDCSCEWAAGNSTCYAVVHLTDIDARVDADERNSVFLTLVAPVLGGVLGGCCCCARLIVSCRNRREQLATREDDEDGEDDKISEEQKNWWKTPGRNNGKAQGRKRRSSVIGGIRRLSSTGMFGRLSSAMGMGKSPKATGADQAALSPNGNGNGNGRYFGSQGSTPDDARPRNGARQPYFNAARNVTDNFPMPTRAPSDGLPMPTRAPSDGLPMPTRTSSSGTLPSPSHTRHALPAAQGSFRMPVPAQDSFKMPVPAQDSFKMPQPAGSFRMVPQPSFRNPPAPALITRTPSQSSQDSPPLVPAGGGLAAPASLHFSVGETNSTNLEIGPLAGSAVATGGQWTRHRPGALATQEFSASGRKLVFGSFKVSRAPSGLPSGVLSAVQECGPGSALSSVAPGRGGGGGPQGPVSSGVTSSASSSFKTVTEVSPMARRAVVSPSLVGTKARTEGLQVSMDVTALIDGSGTPRAQHQIGTMVEQRMSRLRRSNSPAGGLAGDLNRRSLRDQTVLAGESLGQVAIV